MNQDEIKALIIKLLIAGLSPMAMKLGIDGNTLTAIATAGATLAVLLYGVYDHWNMAKVPEDSMVTAPGASAPVVATAVPK